MVDVIERYGDIPLGARIEDIDSGKLTFSRNGARGYRKFTTRFEDRFRLCPRIDEPFSRDFPALLCSEIEVQPYGPAAKNDAKYARIFAQYDSIPPPDKPVENIDFSVQAMTTTRGRKWDDGKKCDQGVTIYYPMSEYSLEIKMRVLPVWEIFAAVGKVNSVDWRGAPRGQMLFEGANARTEWDQNSRLWFSVYFKFLYRPIEHNLIWREDTGAWSYTDPKIYDYIDFASLGIGF